MDLSDGASVTTSRGSCPGADAKFFAGFMAKNFVDGISSPGLLKRDVVIRTRETYGTRRLQTELAENGIIVGRDRLARLRKELRLRCKQKRKFRATTNSNHNLPVAPNLLNQTFAPTAPNQVWVADLTYVATQEGWLYLAGIKDVYTCEIVGYAMGERMTKELTGKALFMALRNQRPPAGLIHHSDRGSQYCAYDYRVIQEQFGLKTSMSRKGNCYDNAPMESFWGTLKNESLSHYRFNNRDEAISVIREYIEIFYNRQRRHSRLGNISPAAFREKYHQMTEPPRKSWRLNSLRKR